MLDEKLKAAADMYPVKMMGVRRGRGAWICLTDQGLRLLKAYPYSQNHLIYENLLKQQITARGFERIDRLCVTKEGGLSAVGGDGKNYVMKQWYDGSELKTDDRAQIGSTASALAALHKAMQGLHIECEWLQKYEPQDAGSRMRRHSRELKTIMNYMNGKKIKNDFEVLYMKYFPRFYAQSVSAMKYYEENGGRTIFEKSVGRGDFCHGEYNYHNVIWEGTKMAAVNFDRAAPNAQMEDLYMFMRKILEKNHWDCSLGMAMLTAYMKERSLEGDELKYLYTLLLYPEKFWKIANHYYNSRKSWTSCRNTAKLKQVIAQIEERNQFIDEFCRII